MSRLRIVVNEYYFYENELVRVVGAKGMDNVDTMRYLIQWGDSQGRACQAEVTRQELSAAPTIERLHHDYRMALDAICAQANRIEELEAKQTLFQDVMGASKTFVERFPGGRLTSQGAHRKMAEEYAEYQVAMERYEESTHDDTPMSLRLRSPYQLRKEAAQELVDLLVTIGGYAASVGLEWGDIEQAAHQTLEKLGKRTTDEYAWFESIMQVAKKSKMESAS
jgi:hypothetical protein